MELKLMIPLTKLIPIEEKAREYGYKTSIGNGGESVYFSKYVGQQESHVLEYANGKMGLWYPAIRHKTVVEYGENVKEQQQLLELALMLQENIIVTEDDENEED
jgi:hypothetical protein